MAEPRGGGIASQALVSNGCTYVYTILERKRAASLPLVVSTVAAVFRAP